MKNSKKKPSNKKPDHIVSDTIIYWTPSVLALIPFAISLNLVLRHERGRRQDIEIEYNLNSQHNLQMALEITTGIFFITTLFCNMFLGRRPSNDDHHNPIYGKIIEGAQDSFPLSLAIGNSIMTFASGTLLGDHAAQAERVISEALTAAIVAQRIHAIDYRLYDHAMDRSTLLDGNMRRLEYLAMRGENAIVSVLEVLAHVAFLAINIGVTRVRVTDSNRLYWISSIYRATDIAEDALVLLMNEYIYYLEIIADRISPALQAIGVANPDHPVHGVRPREIDEVDRHFQAVIGKAAHAVEQAAEGVFHSITRFFGGNQHHEATAPEDDETGGGKMTAEELAAHNARQAAIAAGGDRVEDHHQQHEGLFDGIASALHIRSSGTSVAVAQGANGSHGLDFAALPAGVMRINNLPDRSTLCLDGLSENSRIIVRSGGICYEYCRVSEVHHSGTLGFFTQDHHRIGEIDRHKVHSYHPDKQYVLVRVDECQEIEMRVYGESYGGFGSYFSS